MLNASFFSKDLSTLAFFLVSNKDFFLAFSKATTSFLLKVGEANLRFLKFLHITFTLFSLSTLDFSNFTQIGFTHFDGEAGLGWGVARIANTNSCGLRGEIEVGWGYG